MESSFYDHPQELIEKNVLGYVRDSLGYKRAPYMTMTVPFYQEVCVLMLRI